jgi:hypothetical protein
MVIDPEISSYRLLLERLEKIVAEKPQVNVDPKVEKLKVVSDGFEDIAARWYSITAAPQGLKLRHRDMGRVFQLNARGWRIYADALYTRHEDEIRAALVRLGDIVRSAAYLQYRWAAALQGALVRAGMRVPKWLHGMATRPVLPQS